jgi:hypothetical protein
MNSKQETPEGFVDAAAGFGAGAAEALRWLQRHLDAGDGDRAARLKAVQAQAERHPRAAYLWMLLARAHLQDDAALQALQCWQRAMQARPVVVDDELLTALGGMEAAGWQRLGTEIQVRRAEYLRDAYAEIRRGHTPRDLFRIDRALAGYLGEATVLSSHPTQRPKVMYLPGLGDQGFLDASQHPLVPPLVAQADAIRAEFDEALDRGDGIEPFMGELSGHDKGKYLTGSLAASWDALFFYRHGQRFDDNHRRFPRTSALLESLELCRIDAQAPEVCFSILQPHTRIEPHHGVTNARVVIHIPLRVPPGCYLELSQVGRHYWREGQAMVFDDTFEHSAENPSAQVRGILLMDSWHPALTAVEREAFRAIVEAITRTESAPVT